MTHQKSSFIWQFLIFLTWLQFPWRFLSNSIFLLSILGALGAYFAPKIFKKNKNYYPAILGLIPIIASFILYVNFFKPHQWLNINDQDKFSGVSWEKQLTISIFDYLPIYAKLPPIKKAPDTPEILEGKAEVLNYKKGSDYQSGVLYVEKRALIRLPLFDFPGMEVKVNKKKIQHWHNECRNEEFCLGLITFNLDPGLNNIEVSLKNTPTRNLANFLTFISLGIVVFILLKYRNDKKAS